MSDELKDMLQSVLSESLTPIQTELQGLKNDVANIKNGIAEIKHEQQKFTKQLEGIDAKQQIIYEHTGKLTEYHTETMKSFEQLTSKENLSYFDK